MAEQTTRRGAMLVLRYLDVVEPGGDRDRRTVGVGSEVAIGQRVGDRRPLLRERPELVEQAAFLRLNPRSGVVRDKAGEPLAPEVAQEVRSVEWMEAGARERRRVADVVQVRGGDEHIDLGIR